MSNKDPHDMNRSDKEIFLVNRDHSELHTCLCKTLFICFYEYVYHYPLILYQNIKWLTVIGPSKVSRDFFMMFSLIFSDVI
jgi:hypothetical protein